MRKLLLGLLALVVLVGCGLPPTEKEIEEEERVVQEVEKGFDELTYVNLLFRLTNESTNTMRRVIRTTEAYGQGEVDASFLVKEAEIAKEQIDTAAAEIEERTPAPAKLRQLTDLTTQFFRELSSAMDLIADGAGIEDSALIQQGLTKLMSAAETLQKIAVEWGKIEVGP